MERTYYQYQTNLYVEGQEVQAVYKSNNYNEVVRVMNELVEGLTEEDRLTVRLTVGMTPEYAKEFEEVLYR